MAARTTLRLIRSFLSIFNGVSLIFSQKPIEFVIIRDVLLLHRPCKEALDKLVVRSFVKL